MGPPRGVTVPDSAEGRGPASTKVRGDVSSAGRSSQSGVAQPRLRRPSNRTAIVSANRWERAKRSRLQQSIAPLLAISFALHVFVLLLFMVRMKPTPHEEPMLPSPVAMVFEPPKDGSR